MRIAFILIAAAAAAVLLLFAVCAVVLNQLICLKTVRIPDFLFSLIAGNEQPHQSEYEIAAQKAHEYFKTLPVEEPELNAEGILRAKLLLPEKSNGVLLIACHGARSSAEGEFALEAEYFYKNGFTVLMPEHRGCGISCGSYMGYGTHESIDTYRWLRYAERRFPDMDIFLLGVSMGAATVLMMSDMPIENRVRGIVSDCAYTSAWNEFEYQLRVSFHLGAFPVLHICNLLCRRFAHYSFRAASPIAHLRRARVPVLFIHGTADDFVPYYMQKELYDSCPQPKELLSVEGAAHARSYFTAPRQYESALNSFISKYSSKFQRR